MDSEILFDNRLWSQISLQLLFSFVFFFFFHETNVIERARNLIKFFLWNTFKDRKSVEPLNIFCNSMKGLNEVKSWINDCYGRHLNNTTYCYRYFKNIFCSFVESQKHRTVEQCNTTTETRNSHDRQPIGKQLRWRRLLLHHDLVSITALNWCQKENG